MKTVIEWFKHEWHNTDSCDLWFMPVALFLLYCVFDHIMFFIRIVLLLGGYYGY